VDWRAFLIDRLTSCGALSPAVPEKFARYCKRQSSYPDGAGNSRPGYVDPGDVAVYVTGGRWGPRRVRVSECQVLRAERYTVLLRDDAQAVVPGAT
jgi:hypothetical protein